MNTMCLNCDKEICQTDGKREKLYCSDKCRADFNQKKKVKTKRILLSDWIKLEAGELPPEWVEKYFKKYPDRLPKTTALTPGDQLHRSSSAITSEKKHPLWKEGDPKEGSMAFYNKYGYDTYKELEKHQNS